MTTAQKKKVRAITSTVIAAFLLIGLTACDMSNAFGDALSRAFKGVSATMTTYDSYGSLTDEVHGQSFQITRDTRFDTNNSDGESNKDSSVLQISLGNNIISHVGATLILAQDGLDPIAGAQTSVRFTNDDPGTPWINHLLETQRNLWHGRGKTIMIRSQLGQPIAVFAGDSVDILSTDVPKSTWFRVDGKYLFVYRADYTVYDNDLLAGK